MKSLSGGGPVLIGVMFPGQGSQRSGMGEPWVDDPVWSLVDVASEITGLDLAWLLIEADDEQLRNTRNTQLAAFLVGSMACASLRRVGVRPGVLCGHSVGEYAALAASGVLSFRDAVAVVAARGEAMEIACREHSGTMTAVVGLDDDADLYATCDRAEGDVWISNFNAPAQSVIAGAPENVSRAEEIALEMGANRVEKLAVGGAFHTPFMRSARPALRTLLSEVSFAKPRIPVVANVDARPHSSGGEWQQLLSAQLCSPVRWRHSLLRVANSGVRAFLDLGPGPALSGFVRSTVPGARVLGVRSPQDVDALVAALAEAPDGPVGAPRGEYFESADRLIVSPARGVFVPSDPSSTAAAEGEFLTVGQVVGTVADEPVCSPFAGWLMGLIADPGEKVSAGQPLAWLRAG